MSIMLSQGVRRPRAKTSENDSHILVRMSADQRKRLKHAATDEDCSYLELIMSLLDLRDAKLARQARAQAHPLARPGGI